MSSAAECLERTKVVFKDEAHLRHIIDKIVSNVGRRVDESSPMCDARLPDGSRVNVIIPPVGGGWPDSLHPALRQDSDRGRTTDRQPHRDRPDFRRVEGRGAGQAQHGDLRRHRRGQDDPAQCTERVYRRSASAWSPSRTRPSCNFARNTWSASSAVRPTWKARAPCDSGSW